MSVQEHDVIDMVFPDKEKLYLGITDTLRWSDDGSDMTADMEHAHHLTEKIATYTEFVSEGDIWEQIDKNEYGHLQVVVLVVSQFPLNVTGQATLSSLSQMVSEENIELKQVSAAQLQTMLAR